MDAEDDSLDRVSLLHEVGGLAHFFHPRHLGDVNHAFDSRLQFHERAEIRQAGDRASYPLTCRVAFRDGLPGFGQELLPSQGDPLALGIDLQDLDFDLLANAQDVLRIGYPRPRDVTDVQQAIYAS